jgi:hypothetical protein
MQELKPALASLLFCSFAWKDWSVVIRCPGIYAPGSRFFAGSVRERRDKFAAWHLLVDAGVFELAPSR